MNNRRFLSWIFTLAILGGLCLGIGLLGWGLWNLPNWAASQYGPASAQLGSLQRIYLSAQLLRQSEDLMLPADPLGDEQAFVVELGEPLASITGRLRAGGLIRDAEALRDYLVYAGLDTTLQAGEYQLSPRLSALEIAQALQDATPDEVTFNILPGWRMEEIAIALPSSGLNFSPEAFMLAASTIPPGNPLQAELPDGAGLEGFLFPDSYKIPRAINPETFVNLLVDNFRANLSVDLRQGFARQKLNLYEAVVLASIVQREAIIEDEMPQIASVFLNRLAAGMKLDADPTVQFAIGYNPAQGTWWTNPLSREDLQTNSPYNTYLNWGVPPGPISNPGLKALQAVAYPAQTPYYFFRASCDGSGRHSFAESFEQHVANECP
jgi:UPF0755 protein